MPAWPSGTRRAPFDERVAVMGLIVDATVSCLREVVMEEKAAVSLIACWPI